jgi:hypothetical protein
LEITMSLARTLSLVVIFLGWFPAPAAAQPSAAVLISPSSDVVGSTITFTWHSVAGATWYHFWLGKADTSLVSEHWYTAAHAGCADGGTCAITQTPPLTAGAFLWHIRTWNNSGYGPWSAATMFTVRAIVQGWSSLLPPSRRFTLTLNQQAALDNETGLVWELAPNPGAFTWYNAVVYCLDKNVGGRGGWRLPTAHEVRSLIDPSRSAPALPAGHPFTLGTIDSIFYSETTLPADSANAIVLLLSPGILGSGAKTAGSRVWCVRGGTGPTQ